MPQKTNLNVDPYFDDFDSSKNFYKVLFRPGYSIQSRELTTLQSILQNQIESYGKYKFKQGDLVVPGEVGLNNNLDYVKLSSVSEIAVNVDGEIVYKKYDIKTLIGRNIQGISSGVIATIVETAYATDSNADTLYVKYLTSGDSATETTFRQGETLEVVNGVNTPLMVVGTDGSVLPTTITIENPDTGERSNVLSPAMGYASAVKAEEGIYFVNGFFVRNEESLLIIDSYYNKPSAKVGFKIIESVIFPEEDSSLYDNAQGYSNFASPGATRLKISLSLQKYGYNSLTDKNFIQILKVKSGVIERLIKKVDYTLLEDTLARRTYDESGDYIVDDFSVNVREYYQRNNNAGLYNLNTISNTVNGISPDLAKEKMIVSLGPGKAYVKGYEIVNKETKFLDLDKSRDTLDKDNILLKGRGLSKINVTNVFGSVPLNDEGSELTAFPNVYFHKTFNDGSIGLNGNESTYKKTISRRGQAYAFTTDSRTISNEAVGIKTVYLKESESETALDFATLTADNFQSSLGEIWFKKSSAIFSSVKVLAYSYPVARPEIDSGNFLELTVYGDKEELHTFFREYNEGVSNYQAVLYSSKSGATNDTNEIGIIKDYNDVINPIIGLSKPKNFYFEDYPKGFNANTSKLISKGLTYDGTFSYNYFNPVFFTRLTLDQDISTGTFLPGKYIVGAKSGAYGVIEGYSGGSFSFGNQLFVKTLYGEFVSGESISDEANNVRRIATENTISHFVITKQTSGYSISDTVVDIDGVQFDNSKIELGIANDGKVYKASVLDRNYVTQTYSAPPTVKLAVTGSSSLPSNESKVTAVLFKNTVLNYNASDAKSLYSVFGPGNKNTFSADVDLNKEEYSTSSQVTAFTFSGIAGSKYLESSGFGDDASIYVKQGDIVRFTDSTGNVVTSVVQHATKSGGTDKTRIYLDSVLRASVTNSSVVAVKPKQSNTAVSSLIFPTGDKQVKSLVKDSTDSKFTYYSRRDFVVQASSSGGVLTFAAQLPFGTQRFVSYTNKNYIFTVLNKGSSTVVEDGDILYIDPSYVTISSSTDSTSGLTSGSITINLPEDFFGANITTPFPTLKLTATIETSKAKPRLKTAIRNKRIVITAGGDRIVPLRGYDYDSASTDAFSYSDVYKLKYVYMGGANPPVVDSNGNLITGQDVTNRFTFDDGQRDTFYDVSRLVLKPGFDSPAGQLVVGFDYFEHTQGDFCTVDSYLHEAGVGEDEVPFFNSSVFGNTSLKDVIDFRPKVDNTTTITGFQDETILSKPNFQSFNGSGGVLSSTPAIDSNIEYTISFSQTQYLDRVDGVFLTKDGEFVIKKGNSSLNPSKPEMIDDSIPLCYIYVPAFTNSSADVKIVPVDNRRYTMRDIGKLEKRIERLEHYTTLSILEQQALNMQVKDTYGIDKSKIGFIVDNFEYHKVGNLGSIDYKCAIDTQQSVLRSESKEDSIDIEELNQTSDERSISGYVNNNGFVTLPFTNLSFVKNQFATKTINPNPFVVLQYTGDGQLTPEIDSWYDDTTSPLVVNDNVGLFTIFSAKTDTQDAISSIHNNYIINWVGSNKTFYNIDPLTSLSSEKSTSTVDIASVSSTSNISPQNHDLAQGVNRKIVNNRSVLNSVQYYARTQIVKFAINRMKPKTRMFVFMDGNDIGRWINPDSKFTGIGGNSPTTFNGTITTDDNGNASGIIVIPAGYAPVEGSTWNNTLDGITYDTTGISLKFPTGIKTIRFTSSSTDADKSTVDTYAEVKYYATGILPENPASIISTRPSYFKSNEGVQLIDSNTDVRVKPNPLAQTFKVENSEGGVFTTGIDLFFNKKSSDIPVRVYLSNVELGKPAKNIVPGTECSLNPDTKLKVFTNNILTIKVGENVTGSKSGASGPVSKILDKNNVEVTPSSSGIITLNNEQVYTMVLSNYNGVSFVQEENLTSDYLTTTNSQTSQNSTITISKDSGKISELIIDSVGMNYDNAVLTIESPQSPGGTTAVATCKVHGGKIYTTDLSVAGSGYTENPAVVIRGVGTGFSGAVIKSKIEIDTPAVSMGVANDDYDQFGIVNSIVATRFNFKHPVYLQNNSDYALVVETDSTDYQIWSSNLDADDVATNQKAVTNSSIGSLYKSQNIDNWTEDLFEDIKFTLYRAEFDISRTAELVVKEKSLGYEKLNVDPMETSSVSGSTATSTLFKNNNSIIKVTHKNHGFEDGGNSYVFFDDAKDVGGATASILNSSLFQVSNSGIDTYNIQIPYGAGSSVYGGGSTVLASHNRKFEKLYADIRYLQTEGTNINTLVKTTNIIPVDSNTINYKSYSVTDYETTFLNEDHYFTNQKVIVSDINKTLNDIDNSLTYKIELSSTSTHLSPVIDLSSASIKTSTSRIENAKGKEERFGKRYQKLSFFPVYTFELSGNDSDITLGQTIEGSSSKAKGEVLKYDTNSRITTVKVTSINSFEKNEVVTFSTDTFTNPVSISGNILEVIPDFEVGSTVTSMSSSDPTVKYENKVSGKVIYWDSQSRSLTVENNKQPINNNYNSSITIGSVYARAATADAQLNDIFRVKDFLYKDGLATADSKSIEVSSMDFENGVDYNDDTSSKNSSSVAKYVTKEISLSNSGNSVDVRLTANVKNISDVKVYYRIKPSSAQSNFEDISWVPFNLNGGPDDDTQIANATNTISGDFEDQKSYQELKYSAPNLPEFSSFAIKVIMQSNDPSYVPKVQDMRAVASY